MSCQPVRLSAAGGWGSKRASFGLLTRSVVGLKSGWLGSGLGGLADDVHLNYDTPISCDPVYRTLFNNLVRLICYRVYLTFEQTFL
jgi:hypothetical protein